MLCSEWVPSEWESDKNITIIHTTPVHQLTSGEDKSWNKSIIKNFLTSNCCFWPKYESIIHNNASSSEKVFWSESGEKSAQIKHRLQAKTALNKYVADFDVRDNRRWTFSHCWASDEMLHFSKLDKETNISILGEHVPIKCTEFSLFFLFTYLLLKRVSSSGSERCYLNPRSSSWSVKVFNPSCRF